MLHTFRALIDVCQAGCRCCGSHGVPTSASLSRPVWPDREHAPGLVECCCVPAASQAHPQKPGSDAEAEGDADAGDTGALDDLLICLGQEEEKVQR